jgi:hypothetical protein
MAGVVAPVAGHGSLGDFRRLSDRDANELTMGIVTKLWPYVEQLHKELRGQEKELQETKKQLKKLSAQFEVVSAELKELTTLKAVCGESKKSKESLELTPAVKTKKQPSPDSSELDWDLSQGSDFYDMRLYAMDTMYDVDAQCPDNSDPDSPDSRTARRDALRALEECDRKRWAQSNPPTHPPTHPPTQSMPPPRPVVKYTPSARNAALPRATSKEPVEPEEKTGGPPPAPTKKSRYSSIRHGPTMYRSLMQFSQENTQTPEGNAASALVQMLDAYIDSKGPSQPQNRMEQLGRNVGEYGAAYGKAFDKFFRGSTQSAFREVYYKLREEDQGGNSKHSGKLSGQLSDKLLDKSSDKPSRKRKGTDGGPDKPSRKRKGSDGGSDKPCGQALAQAQGV